MSRHYVGQHYLSAGPILASGLSGDFLLESASDLRDARKQQPTLQLFKALVLALPMAANRVELVTDIDWQRVMANRALRGFREAGNTFSDFVPTASSFEGQRGRGDCLEYPCEILTARSTISLGPFDRMGPT
jgi:hypothetical protein